MKVGDKVKWTSQSNGRTKEKRGTVHAVVAPDVNAVTSLLKTGISRTQIKYDAWYSPKLRYIIAVPRGGKSVLMDYYCPRPAALELEDKQ
ncbi:hypothetical protein [Paenibacillus lutrae]|uniref:DUF2945 domain-containing protein n=1 Tax=Paenibacillus lutrae TaxID=2078573 RepID=A0A7X3FIR0_9BACL|nr:hypothetical protein [Paenibacillus lutrae]MVP00378.1 hypothetical protein [Paenibacillus lutrae]